MWLKVQLGSNGACIGKQLTAGRNVHVVTSRASGWHIGDGVTLGDGVILSVGTGGNLSIGDEVRIMQYSLIGVEESVVIEDRAQIAEHCSIRDHDHDVSARSMHAAPVVSSPVGIGADAWIGRGVAVLRGSRVGAGAVIGANAVVRGVIPDNAVAVGIPARVVRCRQRRGGAANPALLDGASQVLGDEVESAGQTAAPVE